MSKTHKTTLARRARDRLWEFAEKLGWKKPTKNAPPYDPDTRSGFGGYGSRTDVTGPIYEDIQRGGTRYGNKRKSQAAAKVQARKVERLKNNRFDIDLDD